MIDKLNATKTNVTIGYDDGSQDEYNRESENEQTWTLSLGNGGNEVASSHDVQVAIANALSEFGIAAQSSPVSQEQQQPAPHHGSFS